MTRRGKVMTNENTPRKPKKHISDHAGFNAVVDPVAVRGTHKDFALQGLPAGARLLRHPVDGRVEILVELLHGHVDRIASLVRHLQDGRPAGDKHTSFRHRTFNSRESLETHVRLLWRARGAAGGGAKYFSGIPLRHRSIEVAPSATGGMKVQAS